MKELIYKILILPLLLCGCATTQVVQPNIVAPQDKIMANCSEYKLVDLNKRSTNDLVELIYDNALVYKACNTLNEAKKDFILRQQKSIKLN